MGTDTVKTDGFDTVPERPALVTVALFAVVVVASTVVATLFKESALWVVRVYGDFRDPTRVAASVPKVVTALIVMAAVLAATALGRIAATRWPHRSGLEAIAATARGEDRRISLRATVVRSTGTWLTVVGLVPIGRESAIMELGGAIGSSVARRFRGRGAAMAAAGIAAAFATAYHAPIAAVCYLEEHLRIRASRRAVTFTIGGALGGHLLATGLLGGEPIFPSVDASWRQLGVAGLIAVVPATVSSRIFFAGRRRVDGGQTVSGSERRRRWLIPVAAASLAALTVAVAPLTAGNGMDALRRVPVLAALGFGFALSLVLGKALGTWSALGAGAPGGALTPTMTVGAGASLLVVLALRAAGAHSIDVWGVVVLAAAIAIAVGLRSPLTGVVLLPEMTARLALVPATALAVGLAMLLDRGIDRVTRRRGERLPAEVRDEDG